MLRSIAIATLIAGTLDILFAMGLTMSAGREIPAMLRFVASGPFPAASDMGTAGALLGLAVHFALIAIMASVYGLLAGRYPAMLAAAVKWGIIYGLVTYVIMNLILVPLRFSAPLPPSTLSIATQLFAHIVLVGIPIALVTARHLKRDFA
ncbi:MAG: hypothetical protein ABI617_04475 [Sphingomicrobium sp.]